MSPDTARQLPELLLTYCQLDVQKDSYHRNKNANAADTEYKMYILLSL